jgi:4-amino-4-deoxy-L-arabinose transferase-like glycosyltransferase
LFEIVPTKLPHYIMPAYPAIAFLGALWAMRAPGLGEPRSQRILRYVAGVQFLIGVAAFTVAPIVAPKYFGDGLNMGLILFACVGAAAGIAAVVFLWIRRTMFASLCAVLAAVIFYPLLDWGVASNVDKIWMSPKAQALVEKDREPGDPPVVLAGYVEPSLVFLLGTDTQIATGKTGAEIAAKQGGLALVEDHEKTKFFTRLGQLNAIANPVDELSGFNYSRGRNEHITFYRVTPTPELTEPPQE